MAPQTGMGVGAGLAWSYYYGFLRLILPGMKNRIQNSNFNNKEKYSTMFAKVVILLPESCFCPGTLTEESPELIKHVGFIDFKANRAGNKARDYKSSVYEVTNPENTSEKFLVISELGTPLMTLYEMHIDGWAGLTDEQKQEERDTFIHTLKYILCDKNIGDCGSACTFLTYQDKRSLDLKPEYDLPKIICDHIRAEMEFQNSTPATAGLKGLRLDVMATP